MTYPAAERTTTMGRARPGPLLPGTTSQRARARARVNFRLEDGDDPATVRGRRTPAELATAILATLAERPHMKWELRDRLHEPEVAILRVLKTLRAAGQVKTVGRTLDRRHWGLIDWQGTLPGQEGREAGGPGPDERVLEPRSWWTAFAPPGSDRQGFDQALADRLNERRTSRDRYPYRHPDE